jgi:hypothetical protein
MARWERIFVVLLGALVLGAPLAGRWLRESAPRCAWDGLPIQALYRVRVVDGASVSRAFCCVHCASAWLTRHGSAAAVVYVTDEAGGGEIDADAACFVQSAVSTNPVTRNGIHAFRERADAKDHAETFGGRILTGDERPF